MGTGVVFPRGLKSAFGDDFEFIAHLAEHLEDHQLWFEEGRRLAFHEVTTPGLVVLSATGGVMRLSCRAMSETPPSGSHWRPNSVAAPALPAPAAKQPINPTTRQSAKRLDIAAEA